MQKLSATPHERPLAVSLFAGVGGLDLGVTAAGFEVALAIESDALVAAQYSANSPTTQVWCADITQVSGQDVLQRIKNKYPDWDEQLALVCGGPPCQGFSRMGKRDISDPRCQLLGHFVRLVTELEPLGFLMENVAGLTDDRYSQIVSAQKAVLGEFDYKLTQWVLNAKDFGVPQSRKRVFWVGTRIAVDIEQPLPSGFYVTVRDALGGSTLEPTSYSRQLLSTFPAPQEWNNVLTGCDLTYHSTDVIERFAATPPGDVEPISRFGRLEWDGVAPTLRAGTGSDRGNHTAARPIHPSQPRVITVREAARLSSFPDWFQFDRTKFRGFRQIGNAVPPLLAFSVAKPIFTAINQAQLVESGYSQAWQFSSLVPTLQHCVNTTTTHPRDFQNHFKEIVMSEVLSKALTGTVVADHVLGNTPSVIHIAQIEQPIQSRKKTTSAGQVAYYVDLLDCPEIEGEATQTWRDSFTVMRSQLKEQIALGRKLIDIRYTLHTAHGEEVGEKKFNAWLKSKDWGAYGGGWGRTCLALALWWMKLPANLQEWLLNNIQKWSAGAIKRFAAATEIGIDFCIGLVRRGKQTEKSIKRAADSQKLSVGDDGTVVSGELKGTCGKILAIAPDAITLELPDGDWVEIAPENVEKQRGFGKSRKKNKGATETDGINEQTTTGGTDVLSIVPLTTDNDNSSLGLGERVVVTSEEKGHQGERGTIVSLGKEADSWAVQLDDGDEGQVEFWSSQLRQETLVDVKASGEKRLFTAEEVEERVQAEREKLLAEIAKSTFDVERDSVEAEKIQIQVQKLTKELEEKKLELAKYQEIVAENEQLAKRVKELEAQQKPVEASDSIWVGKRIVVAKDEKGWKGCVGVVDKQHTADTWWVKIDNSPGEESSIRELFKTEQLRDESKREVFTLEDFHAYARNERQRMEIDVEALKAKTDQINGMLPTFAANANAATLVASHLS